MVCQTDLMILAGILITMTGRLLRHPASTDEGRDAPWDSLLPGHEPAGAGQRPCIHDTPLGDRRPRRQALRAHGVGSMEATRRTGSGPRVRPWGGGIGRADLPPKSLSHPAVRSAWDVPSAGGGEVMWEGLGGSDRGDTDPGGDGLVARHMARILRGLAIGRSARQPSQARPEISS